MISPTEIGREEAFRFHPSIRTERWLLSRNYPVSNQTSLVSSSQDSGQILEILSAGRIYSRFHRHLLLASLRGFKAWLVLRASVKEKETWKE